MSKIINFMGDLIFGDQPVLYGFGLNSMWSKNNYKGIFDGVKDVLDTAEYNVANFEAIIKEVPDKQNVSEWSMCCEETVCDVLKANKINIVSVANNHTMDYGRNWFDFTVSALEKRGIRVLGLKEKPYVKIKTGKEQIAIIACSYLKTYSKEDPGYLFSPNAAQWKQLVSECSDCSVKIAYVHWGSEFIESPTEQQLKYAHEIISSGIDIIIGHHPHILQTNEIVDGKRVVFSLGNFVSDYWQKRLRKTEIISYHEDGSLKKTDVIINKNGAPEIADGADLAVDFNIKKGSQSVSVNRMRMRAEYLTKIIFNFYRIKEKRAFIKWIGKRVKYVVLYGWRELKNPEIVYEYYEN